MLAQRRQQQLAVGGSGFAGWAGIHCSQPSADGAPQCCLHIVASQGGCHSKAFDKRVDQDVCKRRLCAQQKWPAVPLQRGCQLLQLGFKIGPLPRALPAADAPVAAAACMVVVG